MSDNTTTPQPAGTEFKEEELYPQDVLDSAAEEISRMTPQAYIQLMDYVHNIEEQEKLPEAGGTAWANIYGKTGFKMNLTARGSDLIAAGEKLLRAALYFRDKYGFSFTEPKNAPPSTVGITSAPPSIATVSYPITESSPPQRQEPTYVTPSGQVVQPGPSMGSVASDTNVVMIEVKAVKHVKTLDGSGDYVRAMGGKYMSFGVAAYEEVIPVGIQFKMWPVETKFTDVPLEMKFMQVEVYIGKDKKEKTKVIAFSSHA